METKSESVSASSRTLCVLLDTNIWRSERLLNSPKAQSLIYTIHRRQGILALPEIVEMELPAAIQKAGREANQRAVQASREVSDILGKQDAISDCGDGEFLQAVEARIDALAAILKRVPLTIEITRSALEMVYEKLPPNDKKEEQFRDSAIWQTAIQLADKYKVCFVTTDGAFFEQGKEGFEAAQNILADCKRTAGALSLYRGVAPCLAALDEEMPKIDASLIEQSIVRQTEALIDIELEKEGLTHLSPRTVEIRVYALPADDRLAVDFTLGKCVSLFLQMIRVRERRARWSPLVAVTFRLLRLKCHQCTLRRFECRTRKREVADTQLGISVCGTRPHQSFDQITILREQGFLALLTQ
jgi:predicted nucleic acid-binding protein